MMEACHTARKQNFRDILQKRNHSAFVVMKPQNVRYLSGFTGDSTWLLLTDKENFLLTDSRYTEQARAECPGWQIVETKAGLAASLKSCCEELDLRDLAFDYNYVTVELHKRLSISLGQRLTLRGEQDPCYALRQIKDDRELGAIERAAAVADEALTQLRPRIKPGVSERELAWELNYLLCKLGGDGPAFDTIIAAGPQGALPHARPTDYRLRTGDMVTIDFGAVVEGYCSDCTRTFVLGKPDKLQTERYQAVLEAQALALSGIKPGVTMRSADRFARDSLTKAGYGDYFGHGLGHSFGLEIHEEPRFSPLADDAPLLEGMVMTVEPGLYIPGWGGLRIEDDVAVTRDAIKTLTGYPKTLEEMTII